MQREIFERVNHGVTLSNGEKINGLNKKDKVDYIEDILKNTSEQLKSMGIKNKRYSHYECAAALVALVEGDLNKVSKGKKALEYVKKDLVINNDTKDKVCKYINVISRIYKESLDYFNERKYKMKNMKWTDVLIQVYPLKIGLS